MTAVVVYCEVVYDFILLHSGSFRSDLNHKFKNNSISAFPRCRTNKASEGPKETHIVFIIFVFYSGRRRRVLNYRPFFFFSFFRRTSCMVHAYVPTIYKASEPEQVATSDLEPGLERSYVL